MFTKCMEWECKLGKTVLYVQVQFKHRELNETKSKVKQLKAARRLKLKGTEWRLKIVKR